MKIATHPSPEKSRPLFPSNPTLKIEVLSSPPFWKLGWRLTHPPAKRNGVHTMYRLPIPYFKGPLSGVRQFLTIERPLKLMKNALYSMLKALFDLKMFIFLSWRFGYVEKQFNKNSMVDFKIYDVTDWTTNTYITQYLKK